MFVENRNGISLLWDVSRQRADIMVTSDASGSWGCGALWESCWFHFPWPSSLLHLPLTIKELVPIIVAAALFGHQWQGYLVEFEVDNMVCILVFLASRFNF